MSSLNHKHCLFLLLAVLVSHASLTLHVNSHVAAEQQPCQLCTHYSGFEHAAPPAAPDVFLRALHALEPVHMAAVVPAAQTVPFHQRAPPRTA